jgi:hypothetical protein
MPNPLGYAVGDPVTSAQMNLFNTQIVKAPNFVDGLATYNPVGLIQVGGAGFRWNGPTLFAGTSATTWASGSTSVWDNGSSASWSGTATFTSAAVVSFTGTCEIDFGIDTETEMNGAFVVSSTGVIDVDSGGNLHFDSGSTITGTGTVANGATLALASGGTLSAASGSTVTAASGSTVNLGGATTLTNSTNLNLSPARNWERHSLRIAMVSYIDGSGSPANNYEGPERPAAWISNHTGGGMTGFESPFIRTELTRTAVYAEQHYHWVGLDDLPNGATFTQVVVTSTGVNNTPTTTAKYRIIRIASDGTVENMSNLTDRTGTWTNSVETTVTVNAHATISSAYRYALVVVHPLDTGGAPGTGLRIFDVESSGTMSSVPTG